jgi:hypothetical protein
MRTVPGFTGASRLSLSGCSSRVSIVGCTQPTESSMLRKSIFINSGGTEVLIMA